MVSQKYIYVQSSDSPGGLHCLNLENGEEKWWFDPQGNMLGITPAIDQTNGFVYFQTRNRLWKINALTGALLDYVALTNATMMASGNTILVDDLNGYFITQCSYDFQAYGGAVKVFDENLDLVWGVTGLNLAPKVVMAYYDGVLYVPVGNTFKYDYVDEWYSGELENAGIKAYDITDGTLLWTFICDPEKMFVNEGHRGVIDVIYCNGYLFFKTVANGTTEAYCLDSSDGSLVKKLIDVTGEHEACAPSVFSGGRLYEGSGFSNSVVVYQFGTGDYKDWNTYGSTPQLNHNVAHADNLTLLDETPSIVGSVAGGDQGGVIINSVGYFIKNANCVKFNPATLAVADNWTIGNIWDSTPIMLKNLADDDVLLIKENENARVIAIDPATGDRLWNSAGDMPGNVFFGINYYESDIAEMIDGMTSAEYIAAINDNFTALNALVADAASITTITTQVGQDLLDAINDNVDALNAELGTPVAWTDIALGETGLSAITKMNDFNIAFKLVA